MDLSPESPPQSGQGAGKPRRVRVWDLPTRVFHWSFALSFAGAWLSADSERLRDVHLLLGYIFAGMLVFRLLWGFVGTRYARFSSFLVGPAKLRAYLASLFSANPQHHVGHNPAGAVAILLLLALGAGVATSGYLTELGLGGEWFEESHELLAGAMLAVVVVHLAGVIVGSLLHRENLAAAMLTGWKRGAQGDGIAGMRYLVGILLVLAVAAFAWSFLGDPPQPGVSSGDFGSVVADRHHRDHDD